MSFASQVSEDRIRKELIDHYLSHPEGIPILFRVLID